MMTVAIAGTVRRGVRVVMNVVRRDVVAVLLSVMIGSVDVGQSVWRVPWLGRTEVGSVV